MRRSRAPRSFAFPKNRVPAPRKAINRNERMEKILVIKPSSLGDIVHALVVVETLRRRLGDGNVHITWLVRDIFSGVLEATPTVDRIIRYNRQGGIREIVRVGKQLRRERFDLVLDLQGLARSAFWAWNARAPRKIGRGDGREGSRLVFRELAPPPPKGFKHSHAIEILLQFLKPLGFEPKICGNVKFSRAALSPEISALFAAGTTGAQDGWTRTGAAPTNATGTVSKNDFPAPILVFPESRRAEKEWNGFRTLTEMLLEKFPGVPVAWVGGNAALAPKDLRCAGAENFRSLLGKTTLGDVLALVARARLCVTNDSGPMHIAAASGVPVLGVFGPTSPELYGPFPPDSPKNRVVCAPDGDLKKLPADDVFRVAAELLSAFPPRV